MGQSPSVTSRAMAGPTGRALRLEDLPAPDTIRWVARRKALVIAGVRAGLLSRDDACRTYGLTDTELEAWQHAVDLHGLRGLSVTRLGHFRKLDRQAPEDAASPRR